MKKMLLLVLALFCTVVAWAARVTSDEVRTAATRWLETNFIAKQSLAETTVKAVRAYDAEASFYIVELAPQGHILVSGSDLVNPILSFAKTDFALPEGDDPYAIILANYVTLVTSAEAEGGTRSPKWTKLLASPKGSSLSTMAVGDTLGETSSTILVEPFLTTKWNQIQPYNDYSKLLYSSEGGWYRGRVPCGCTCTAFAQIFYYWKWPAWTDETKLYNAWFVDSEGTHPYPMLFAGHEAFQWDKMTDIYPTVWSDMRGVMKESDRFPIARLFGFTDALAHMKFQSGGSAAAFENLVGYGDAEGSTKPWYTMPASEHFKNHAATAESRAAFIKNYIEPDLVNGMPIPLTVPGHAVIADGLACNYEEDEYYLHVNYGWGGSSDNWYTIYTVNEETGTVSYSFTQVFPGFKPLKMMQVRRIPANYPLGENIVLEWALPNYYTKNLTGFAIQEVGGSEVLSRSSFSDGFTSTKGVSAGVSVMPYFDAWLRFQGKDTEGTYTYPDSFTIDSETKLSFEFQNLSTDGELHIQASADGVTNWVTLWGGKGSSTRTKYSATFENYFAETGASAGVSVKVRLLFKPCKAEISGMGFMAVDVYDFNITDIPEFGNTTIATLEPDVRTYTIEKPTSGQHVYKVEPLFSDDFTLDTNPSVTVMVDAADAPTPTERPVKILNVMSSDSQRRKFQEGFYRECAGAGKNLIWVECTPTTTELKATALNPDLLTETDFNAISLGDGKFALEIDASKITEDKFRLRTIVTLQAKNGTFSDYKDLSLRFSGSVTPEAYTEASTWPTGEDTSGSNTDAIDGVPMLATFKGFNDLKISDEDGINEYNVTTTGGERDAETGAITIKDRAIIIKNLNAWSRDQGIAILLKYSNLKPGTDSCVLMTTSINAYGSYVGGAMTPEGKAIGAYADDDGFYDGSLSDSIPESGYLLLTYGSGGTHLYVHDGATFVDVLKADGLKTGGDIGQMISIGGTPSHTRLAAGMVVEGVAIFKGNLNQDNRGDTIGVYTNVPAPTTVEELPDETADVPIDLTWTPGTIPISETWISSWEGEDGAALFSTIGPRLSDTGVVSDVGPADLYVISSARPITRPYSTALPVRRSFTLMTYGCVDFVQPSEGKHAILWDMGRTANRKLMLLKGSDGHVKFAQVTGTTIDEVIDVGELKGYHLITVRVNADGGSSVQIDNNEPVTNANLRLLPNNNGIQFGTCLGGLPEGFEMANNFIICKVLGFDTTFIPDAQYEALCADYPAVTTMPSFTYDVVGGTLNVPNLTAAEGQTATVTQGTLNLAKGITASLGTVSLGGSGTGISVNGGSLIIDDVTATANGGVVNLTEGGMITYGTSPNSSEYTITKNYGYGTVIGSSAWTDKDAIKLTDSEHGTTFYADGVTLTYTGSFTGNISGTTKAIILTENAGRIVFAGSLTLIDLLVTPGSDLMGAPITNSSALTFRCQPFGGSFDRPTGWLLAWDAGSYTKEGQCAFVNTALSAQNGGRAFDPLYSIRENWHPTKMAFAPKSTFTLGIYGCADFVKASEGKVAVLWSMGSRDGEKLALVKDSAGNIKFIQATGSTIHQEIDAGKVTGYHFFKVRFDTTAGASLQIDSGDAILNTSLTTPPDYGFSLGSVAGGCPEAFEVGEGFPIYAVYAVDTIEAHSTFNNWTNAFPAATEISTDVALTADDTAPDNTYYLPSLTFAEGTTLSVSDSTLVVPAGVVATVDNMVLGAATSVVNVDGGHLTVDALTSSVAGATMNVINNGTLIINGALPEGVTVNVEEGATCRVDGQPYPLPPASVEVVFDWTPGTNPTGSWFTSWGGANGGGTHQVIGTSGTLEDRYMVFHDAASMWHPYIGMAAKDNFTLATYGCIDRVAPTTGKHAVLWCMGARDGNKLALVKDSAGNLQLLQVVGSTTTTISAGKVKRGYHLFTVRFDTTTGASLQIDDGPVYTATSPVTTVSATGFQVGAVYNGLTSTFERGIGFVINKMVGYNSSELSSEQYAELCAAYPAILFADVTDVHTTVSTPAEAEALRATLKAIPTADDLAAGMRPEHLMLVVEAVKGSDGTISGYTLVVALNPETVTPPSIVELTPPVATEGYQFHVSGAVLGIWYGYEVSDTVGGPYRHNSDSFSRATADEVGEGKFKVISTPPRTEPTGFFRVKALPAKPNE